MSTATNIDKGTIYITSGTLENDTITIEDGEKTVRIDDQKLDENLQNTPIEFNIPVPPGASTVQPSEANIIDLKQIKHVLSIQGVLITDSTDTAFTKKKILKVLAGYGGTVEDSSMIGETLKSGTVTFIRGLSSQNSQEKMTGNIVKIMFTETPGKISDGTTDTQTDLAYAVQVQISVGKERKV